MNQNEVLKCLASGIKSGKSYSAEVRKFCLELHFQRPSAYRYVRAAFENHLPHERTIGLWYQFSNVNQGNGVCQEAFERLEQIVKQMNGEKLICSLIFDEIYIRKQILRCRESSEYVGYVTYGSEFNNSLRQERDTDDDDAYDEELDEYDEEELPCANQAIVFMLCGLNKRFKLPIAYEFIRSLDAFQRANLTMLIIKKITQSGIRIANLTFDGYSANHKMCELLGANLNVHSDDFRPYLINPIDEEKIYILKDPSHMQKLIRNTLGAREVLFDEDGQQIRWNHIEKLEKLGRKHHFLTHKLTKRHIQYKKSIMDVQISRETLSGPVADSLQYLKDKGYNGFKDCHPTIKFIRKMDKLAAVCNSHDSNKIDPFEKPLNSGNIRIVNSFFSECLSYIKSLKITGKQNSRKVPITKSIRKVGFSGMIINMKVLLSMYEEFVVGGLMHELPTYAMSQDHLEALFGRLRARQGSNDNPNVVEFKGAWRKLLCGNLENFHTAYSNARLLDIASPIIPFTDIYTISSRRPDLDETEKQSIKEKAELEREHIQLELEQLTISERGSHHDLARAGIALMAKSIERKIEAYHFNCEPCKLVFVENSALIGCFANSENLNPPCDSTFRICEIADKFLRLHKPSNARKHDFNVLYCLMFDEINKHHETLYTQSKHLNECNDHRFHLFKVVVDEYVGMKLSQMCEQRTLEEHDKIVRKSKTKAIHFAGQ